jgi:hypothetical protein
LASRARERAHRLPIGVLEHPPLGALDLEQVPEVARVEQELLLRALSARPRRRGRVVDPAGDALHHRQ